MKHTVRILAYEIKKITDRKMVWFAFFMMLGLTILFNLWSIPLYSIGTEGKTRW